VAALFDAGLAEWPVSVGAVANLESAGGAGSGGWSRFEMFDSTREAQPDKPRTRSSSGAAQSTRSAAGGVRRNHRATRSEVRRANQKGAAFDPGTERPRSRAELQVMLTLQGAWD